jgi:F-type H+-transporting ATPase subunit alpha
LFFKNLHTGSIDTGEYNRFGIIYAVSDGIARITGLKLAFFGEIVDLPQTSLKGIICNLNRSGADVLILGDDRFVKSGHFVITTGFGANVPVSKKLLGKVINPLGDIISENNDEKNNF